MSGIWRIELFGGLRLVHGCRVVTRFRTQKTGALLGLLAFKSDERLHREMLIETFWGDDPAEHARLSLSVALTHLRGMLEPPGIERGAVLQADRYSIMLSSDLVAVDTAEFVSRVEEAQSCPNRRHRLPLLFGAVEQYRPEILSGYGTEWVLGAQAALNLHYARAVVRLAKDLTAELEMEEAVRVLRRAVDIEPLEEAFHRQLIQTHARMGNPGSAIQQYEQMASILRTELQSRPSAADQDFICAIRGGLVPDSAVNPLGDPLGSQYHGADAGAF